KDYNIPQNRERVFIVGIRDDKDNNFTWPKEDFLTKRLRDVLESDVDEKYFLSDKMIEALVNHSDKHKEKGNGFKFEPKDLNDIGNSVTTKSGQRTTDNFIRCNQGVAVVNVVANLPGKHEQNSRVYGTNGLSPTLTTMQGGGQEPKISTGSRIRKLTPRECFRLMDFPDTFSWPVSDTQAYKQAGNSICVGVLAKIIQKLKL